MEYEQTNNQFEFNRETFIRSAYAEKKGRDVLSENPYTCYIKINSPKPNLPCLTSELLDELDSNRYQAFTWALMWDKSIVSIAPNGQIGCELLLGDDPKGKNYLPVATTKPIDSSVLLQDMPEGELGVIAINDAPMTIDAFLIVYFHMVNELVWDLARSENEKPNLTHYSTALDAVLTRGFSVTTITEQEIMRAKALNPDTSVRIYGSKVNGSVPQIMGAILKS